MTKPVPGIGRQMAKGAVWMVLARAGVRVIGVASTIVLARLLVPADFGLVALATTIVAGLEIFSLFSFDLALIRDNKAGRGEYDTAWTLTILRGFAIALLLLAGANAIAEFFNDARLVAVMWALAALSAVEGFQNIAIVNFRKEMNFHLEFRFLILQKIVAFVVTLVLAFAWRDYWALLAGIAASRMTGLVLSFTMIAYRPRPTLREWRGLISFAKGLLANNIISFFATQLDQFMLGRMLGAYQLGLYTVAKEIASLPTAELIMPIQRALFPGFSRIKDDSDQLRRTFLDSFAMITFLALPGAIGIALVADPLVRLFLGEDWIAAIALLQILSVFGATRIGHANIGSVLLAQGHLATLNYLGLIYIALQVVLLVAGINLAGATGAALGLALASLVYLAISLCVTCRFLDLPALSLLKAVWRPGVSAMCMVAAVVVLQRFLPVATTAPALAAALAASVAAGAFVYYGANLSLWHVCGRPHGAEATLLGELKRQFSPQSIDRAGARL